MVACLRIAVLVGLLACVYAVENGALVTVEKGSSAPAAPKSSTMTNKYCESAPGLICPKGNVIGTPKFTPVPYMCHSMCVRAPGCVNAHWNSDSDRKCILKDESCTDAELVPGSGTDFMRLPRGQKCSADRPEYKKPAEKFTSTFCAMYGKKCSVKGSPDRNYNMYPSPQNIKPWVNCLKKCMAIIECASADYVANKCYINDYHCPDEELVPAEPGDINFMRLPKGDATKGCPPNRGAAPPGGGAIPEPEEPAPEAPAPEEPAPEEPAPEEPAPEEPAPEEPAPEEPAPEEPAPEEPAPEEPAPEEPAPEEPAPEEPAPEEPAPEEPAPEEPAPEEPAPATPAPCLCPCNSTQDADGNCQCDAGFKKAGGKCVPDCPAV